jgi:tetratricopeptide (TPR) repeat protein/beta-lactamase regulating signal transducer with metallopeptidase domain
MNYTDLLSTGNFFWLGMANHLWQSTLFAAAAWVITIFLKKNRARIRYWIWFAVSIKFLIPFSFIIRLGGFIAPEWTESPVEISPEWNVIQTINQPFNPPELEIVSPTLDIVDYPSPSNKIPLIILSLWLCGSFVVLLNWQKRGKRVSRILHKAEPLTDDYTAEVFHRIRQESGVSTAVQPACTHDSMEPGVFGIFRTVLLLPAGILKRINDSELEAILLHEFEHIRCKDNLIALIHMLVEALYWFHPVVWWAGSRLVFERELACDESVTQSGRNPKAYAEGILKVCEYYFESPLACISGVIGSNLKKRVEDIMKNQTGHKLSLLKKLFLSAAVLSVLGIPLSIGIINAPPSQAIPSDSNLNESIVDAYKPDTYQFSRKPELKNESTEITKVKAEKTFSSDINSDPLIREGRHHTADKSTQPKTAVEQTSDNINKNAGIQNANNNEKQIVLASFQPVDKRALKNTEDSIVLIQDETVEVPIKNEANVSDIRVMDDKPEDAATYSSRGNAYLKKGQIDKAISNFNKAIGLSDKDATLYLLRGNAYIDKKNYDQAINDYSKAIELNPEYAAAYNNRGYLYHIKQEYKKAIDDYSKGIKINPEFIYAYYNRGNAYYAKRQYRKAISDYSKIIKINSGISLAYAARGSIYYQRRSYRKAILDCTKALELNDKDARIYLLRGNAYRAKRKYEQAINDYNKVVELNPEFAAAYINRGQVYEKIDDHKKAIYDYSKAIEIDPENIQAYLIRGDAYSREKHYDKAISDYSKAIEIAPDFTLAYTKRGDAYHRTGQYKKGENDRKIASKLDPDYYARILVQRDKENQAEQAAIERMRSHYSYGTYGPMSYREEQERMYRDQEIYYRYNGDK